MTTLSFAWAPLGSSHGRHLLLVSVLASCTLACGMACSTRCGSSLVSWTWLLGASWRSLFPHLWDWMDLQSLVAGRVRKLASLLRLLGRFSQRWPCCTLRVFAWASLASLSFPTWDFRAPVGAEHNAVRRPRVGCVVVTSEDIVESSSFLPAARLWRLKPSAVYSHRRLGRSRCRRHASARVYIAYDVFRSVVVRGDDTKLDGRVIAH